MKTPATLLLILALTSATTTQAQMVTEVISLGYRSVGELLPVLEPLVAPPGTVTGMYTTLVVKGTRADVEAVKQVLASLDKAPRNLLITVRQGMSSSLHASEGEGLVVIDERGLNAAAGGVGAGGLSAGHAGDGSRVTVRVFDTRTRTGGRDVQRVRVLEGYPAYIRFGESIPVAQRSIILFGGQASIEDTISYRDVTSGFYALPRLSGDTVVIQISPQRERLSAQGGARIDVQHASTVVSGPLGQWIALGGATSRATSTGHGTLYATRSHDEDTRTLYLKVDVLD